jgi:hypothetical protein
MARSAHAYVRGNRLKFYEWLEFAGGKLVWRALPCGYVAIAIWEISDPWVTRGAA